jgi:Flp pilus assembly pilin Flp
MSLSLATVLAGWSRPQGIGRVRGHPSFKEPEVRLPWLKPDPKRLVNHFMADGSSASVIESGLIIVLVGLACMTAWMHVSASLKIPSASADTTASVETTGSVRSQELHRASRTRRLRRSEKRLYGAGCPAQVRMGRIAPVEAWSALSRSCAASPSRRSLSLQPGQ